MQNLANKVRMTEMLVETIPKRQRRILSRENQDEI
jgi:hypothetical protein